MMIALLLQMTVSHSFLWLNNISLRIYMYIYISTYITFSLFIHVSGHLGCFHILVLVSSAAIDIGKHTSF